MKKSDVKKGVKVKFRGQIRTISIDRTKRPYINWKNKKKWQWGKWELVKDQKSSKQTTSRKKASTSKNKTSKPTLHLVWKKHPSNDKFTNHFNKLKEQKVEKEKKMSSQGWYCLGSTNNIGYIGLVGRVWSPSEKNKKKGKKKKPRRRQSRSTFITRWNEHDSEEMKDAKFPNGYFKTDKIKINNKAARLHTASIVAARNKSTETNRWKPLLFDRGVKQAEMIERIESFIIYYAAQRYKDLKKPRDETKRFYMQKGRGWEGGRDNPKPYKFPSQKTMVNSQSLTPPSTMIFGGDFNIKFSGNMPNDLKKIFSKGVYVKDALNPKKK